MTSLEIIFIVNLIWHNWRIVIYFNRLNTFNILFFQKSKIIIKKIYQIVVQSIKQNLGSIFKTVLSKICIQILKLFYGMKYCILILVAYVWIITSITVPLFGEID